MPVRLCDGVVYNILYECMDQDFVRSFFLGEHRNAILALYDVKDKYLGCITYNSFLKNQYAYDSVVKEKLLVSEDMFKKAQDILDGNRDLWIPVFNDNMEMLYFARYEYSLQKAWKQLSELRSHVSSVQWKRFRESGRHFHIVGMNDVLYFFRTWLLQVGATVSVEGEQWNIFGIEEEKCKDKDAIIIDGQYHQLNILHEEYRGWMKDDIVQLEQLVLKPYEECVSGNDQILFYMPVYAYFLDSVSPLIYRYLRAGKKCILAFMDFEKIIVAGQDNVRKMIKILKRIESEGGKVCNIKSSGGGYLGNYQICYLCSEYSGMLPVAVRENSDYVVELQTTALYTHMYSDDWRFEYVFSDKERKRVDFLIATSFMSDWICEKEERWDNKILKFGYPKLDTLYCSLKNKDIIPKEWEKKINGRKTFLFTIMEESWLDILLENDWMAIWRPHPLTLEENADRIHQVCERYNNIIVDDLVSYYASFLAADAMIAGRGISATMVSFLYTGKMVCFYEGVIPQIMDYRQEAWYKSTYVVSKSEDVTEFIKLIGNGEFVNDQEMERNRKLMTREFDGKVCDRIYHYFEKI